MHAMNKMQNERQKPNHEGNNITHLRKRQELELQIWKVVSGALHKVPIQSRSPDNGAPRPTAGAKCRVVGATYAKGWLIIVGASKT